MVFHLISLEEGDYASNAFNAVNNAGIATTKLATGNPMYWWFDVLVLRGAGTVFDVARGNAPGPDSVQLVEDVADVAGPGPRRGRSPTTSVLSRSATSCSRHDAAEQRPRRRTRSPAREAGREHQHADTIVGVFGSLFGKLLVMLIPREDYCHPFDSATREHFAKTALFYGVFMRVPVRADGRPARGLVRDEGHRGRGSLLEGVPVARLGPGVADASKSSRAQPDQAVDVLGRPSLRQRGRHRRRDVQPRRRRVLGLSARGLVAVPAAVSRRGSRATSRQANQGMCSHNFVAGNLVYSYDFSLDEDDVILAARPGTVVDFFDWVPNDKTPTPTSRCRPASSPGPGQTARRSGTSSCSATTSTTTATRSARTRCTTRGRQGRSWSRTASTGTAARTACAARSPRSSASTSRRSRLRTSSTRLPR